MAAPTEGAWTSLTATYNGTAQVANNWSAATAADGIVLAVIRSGTTGPGAYTLGTSAAASGSYSWTALYSATVVATPQYYGVYWAPALAGTVSQNKPTIACTNTNVVITASFHYFKGAAQTAPVKFRNSSGAIEANVDTTPHSYNLIGNGGGFLNGYPDVLAATWLLATGSLGAVPAVWPEFTSTVSGFAPTRQITLAADLSAGAGIGYYQDPTAGASNGQNNTVNNIGVPVVTHWGWGLGTARSSVGLALAIIPATFNTTANTIAATATPASTAFTAAMSVTGSTATPVVTIPQTPSGVTVATTSKVTSITASSSSSGLGASLSASTLAPTVAIPATASTPSGAAPTTASSLDIAADATNGNVNAGMLTSASTLGINLGIAGVVNRTLVAQATTLAINAGFSNEFKFTFTSPQLDDLPQYLPDSSSRQVALFRHFKRRTRNLVVALLSDYSTAQDTPSDGHPNSLPYPWNPNDPGAPFATAWMYNYPGNYISGTRPAVQYAATYTTQFPYIAKILYGSGTQNITYQDAQQLLYNGYQMASYGSTPQPGQVAIGYVDESTVTYAAHT